MVHASWKFLISSERILIAQVAADGDTASLEKNYRFHTKTAVHFFCKVCGIYPFHRKRVTPDNLGINVHCLHDFAPTVFQCDRLSGDGMKDGGRG